MPIPAPHDCPDTFHRGFERVAKEAAKENGDGWVLHDTRPDGFQIWHRRRADGSLESKVIPPRIYKGQITPFPVEPNAVAWFRVRGLL